ncbi:MAG: Na+/H+ antiporter NhaC family protein [Spirochaetaceae bacterium]|jgi:Na+/H+ antiporter NhaC|nr:Na+/H+ antiporter NhaC family protein [Spirochaetaceae bacterium]
MAPIDAGVLSVMPPLLAIGLALLTKKVLFSLILGIFSGVGVYVVKTGLGIHWFFPVIVETLVGSVEKNAAMVIFLCLLGALVALIARAGGARAYGTWAAAKLSTKRSVSLVTALLGMIIFIDDYFNCLTIGTVMRPVTDRRRISREKLAYFIDSTAAPVCVIAPISSWAAAAAGYFPAEAGISGMQAFILSIPFNLYALLTSFMVLWMGLRNNADFGPMRKAEERAARGGLLYGAGPGPRRKIRGMGVSDKGTVLDLIVPVVFLVGACVTAMLFYGGLWNGDGTTLAEAFVDTDANSALTLGGLASLVLVFFLYVPRGLISFKDFFVTITRGVKSMVSAILILTLAWTIAAVCKDMLNTGTYLASLVERSSLPVGLIPAIMFAAACAISFSTGTAWGTFGILIPITITVCYKAAPQLSIPTLGAVMGGAVFGDHCSPISDTTILSSTGAVCNHISHVATQIPYAVTVAVSCLISYSIVGLLTGNAVPDGVATTGAAALFNVSSLLCLPLAFGILLAPLLLLPKISRRRQPDAKGHSRTSPRPAA